MTFKPIRSLLLYTTIILLIGCGGDVVTPTPLPTPSATSISGPSPTPSATSISSPSPTQSATAAPTPYSIPNATAVPIPYSTPSGNSIVINGLPAPITQSTEVSKVLLHEFNGNGTGETDEFYAEVGANIQINYKGGPIKIFWIEEGDAPRQMYHAPPSNNGSYDTNTDASGRYSIGIQCDDGCEWIVRIEGIGEIASPPSTIISESNTNASDTDARTILDSSVEKEEWDVFSQSEAAVILSAPNTKAITLTYDPETRTASITGAKTSVPPEANVMIANLQLGNFVLVKADQDGKFQAEIDGHPGTHILIKQDTTGQIFIVEDPEATHSENTLRTIFPPGVLLRIPVEDSETGISFSSAGRLPSDKDAPWTIEGNLAQTQLSPGQEVPISGQVAIRTRQSNPPLGGQLRFGAHLLINANGRQVGGASLFTTSLFTATDLPIE
ncbi:uncharacterized protein METZ01_LOCUS96526, partial [marine metagenome]